MWLPYTNVLDFGVWMCLQSAFERQHYLQRCNTSVLCNTVFRTWNEGNLDRSISNVFGRLKNVMCNLIQAKGSNDLMEDNRCKKKIENQSRG